MNYTLRIKDEKKGKALIRRLKSLPFVELKRKTENDFDVEAFRRKIRKAERSKALTVSEAIEKTSGWLRKKN